MNPVKILALGTMLLAMLASNTGCFWLAVGGAGAAGGPRGRLAQRS
jgi:hypothetical protein